MVEKNNPGVDNPQKEKESLEKEAYVQSIVNKSINPNKVLVKDVANNIATLLGLDKTGKKGSERNL